MGSKRHKPWRTILNAGLTPVPVKLRIPGRTRLRREDASEHFGWLALIRALNGPTSSGLTRQRLGWNPTGPGLIEDLEQGHYFSGR